MKKLLTLITIIWLTMPNAIAQLIIEQPVDTSVCPEGVAEFHISVADQVDSVEWQVANMPTGPWMPPMGGVSGINDTILIVSQPNVYADKYFRAVVWDTLDNIESSDSVILNVYPGLQADINPNDTSICNGQSVTLTAFPANAHYEWSTSALDTLRTIVVSIANTYLVTVTDANGCIGSSSATVTVNSLPTPILFAPADPKICTEGDTSVILGTVAQYYNYLWSTGETSSSITVTETGDISLTVTDMNGCTAFKNGSVTTYSVPVVDIVPSMPEFCEGESISLTAIGGNYNYLWSQGSTNQSITVNDSATYSVTITDINGCQNSDEFTPTVNPIPIAGFTTNPGELINILVQREILFIDSSVSTGAPIENWDWDFGINADPPFAEYTEEGESTLVKYTQPGLKKVKLTITDINGCSSMDSILFVVNSASSPEVNLILIAPTAECLGDTVNVQVTVTTLDQTNYIIVDKVIWGEGNEFLVSEGPKTYNETKLTLVGKFVFDQPGMHTITVTGYRKHRTTGIEQPGTAFLDVDAGSVVPQIDAILPSAPFLCRGDSMSYDVFIFPAEDAEINYSINGLLMPLGQAINGHLRIENVPATINSDKIILTINSIDLNNGCKNDTLDYSLTIGVRPKPNLIVVDTTYACVDTPDTLVAYGAVSFIWRNYLGQLLSSLPVLPIPTNIIQKLTYVVTGTTDGCSMVDTAFVEVVSRPSPDINGSDIVCKGQRVSYTSNSNTGNFWSVDGGIIDGSDNEQVVSIIWNSSGSVRLKQQIGGCTEETPKNVTMSSEESPPFKALEYLAGGGILLYPNPDLIPNLCYKWYKDGQLLPDTFQGCVVGTNLTDSELKRFSVKVYYCNKDTGCAQLISRSVEQVPVPTEFHLLAVPNPNSGNFSLQYNITNTGNYIRFLFDSSSRVLRKETIALDTHTGIINMSLSNLAVGVYFIKLINAATGEYQVVPVSILQ